MALDVIGVGYPRTGTASLKAALEMIGFGPCYHMSDSAESSARVRAERRVEVVL